MSELRRLFDLVCDLPAAQRADILRDAGADPGQIAEVISLLDADSATHTLMRAPVRALMMQFNATELQIGDVLDAWRLVRELGHGGMGAVFLADRADGHFNQQAAVKLIRGLGDADAILRFARERQLLADLQHPQIARLLDGGATPSGQPYLVMEYIDGRALDVWCRETDADLKTRLRIFVSICNTLQFAHQRLIVHCDLKPSNVLVRADGVPVLLDFGIAQALDRSESGEVMRQFFTPRYASPEQARGETPTIASDIFSLGALLYELVCEQPPPDAEDAAERKTLPRPSAVVSADVPWHKRLKGDLDAIVMRACAFEPAKRYSSAQALAEDIQRIDAHRPVLARRHTLTYVGFRLVRRFWPIFAALALALAFVTALLVQREVQSRHIQQERDRAEAITRFTQYLFDESGALQSRGNSATVREMLDHGAEELKHRSDLAPEIKGALLLTMARAYNSLMLGKEAKPLIDAAKPLLDQADSLQQAELASVEGNSVLLQGHLSEAIVLLNKAIALLNAAPGEHAQEITELRIAIDGMHADVIDVPIQKTIDDVKSIIAELDAAPQRSDRLLLSALNTLGQCYVNSNDSSQLVPVAERAVALASRLYSDSDRRNTGTKHTLALALMDTDPPRAAAQFAELLADYDRYSGTPSISRAGLLYNMGKSLRYSGKYAQAADAVEQAAASARELGGARHRLTLTALDELGVIYNLAGTPEKTINLLTTALPDFAVAAKDGDEADRDCYAMALATLGEAERLSHNYSQASQHLAQSDEILSKLDPEGFKDDLFDLLESIARLRLDQGDAAGARSAIERYAAWLQRQTPLPKKRADTLLALRSQLPMNADERTKIQSQ